MMSAYPYRLGRILAWSGLMLFLSLSAGCAPKNVFVLMPDDDGRVGAITVRNEKGAHTIDRAGQGVVVADAGTAPSAPAPVSEADLREWFGEARKAVPMAPQTFVLLFDSGTSVLTGESQGRLPDIMETIRKRSSRDISVVGHSDRKGDEQSNWKLSLERAEVVRGMLVDLGVPPEAIETTSHGEGNPLIPTENDVAEPRNRRVEVTVR